MLGRNGLCSWRVYDTTKFAHFDERIRERGYEVIDSIVRCGIRPEDPFDFYQLIRHYSNEDTQAIATWIGVDPEKIDSGEVSYDMIVDLDELQDLEGETYELYPHIVTFLTDEKTGSRATSTGIDETGINNICLSFRRGWRFPNLPGMASGAPKRNAIVTFGYILILLLLAAILIRFV